MSAVVIDTNVAVVANRQNPKVTPSCEDACVRFLTAAKSDYVVLLDQGDEVRAEYARALKKGRPYQVGAQFLFHIYQQMDNPERVGSLN